MAEMFQGFPRTLPQFLAKLTANNNRDWFEANKSEYQEIVVRPALDFITALEPVVAAFNPPHKAEARLNGSLRRINRDIRFSKDKTPYNPRLHMIFWTGSHPNRSPACHVVLGAKHFGFGAGQWGFDKTQLENYRAALMVPEKFSLIENALEVASKDKQIIDEPHLKRLPKGYEAEGLLADLLRQKGIVVKSQDEPCDNRLFTPDCVDYIKSRMQPTLAINKWLLENVN